MTATLPSWQGLDLAGGRYRVTARLGAGGMAEVYRAWDRNLQTEVIIKVPLPELLRNPAFAARFGREVRSLVQLAHPHIVKVLDVGEHAGVPFAVMQFLAGGTLHDRLTRGGAARPQPPASLTGWLGGVAGALDFIHARGFVHRDVKPGNILFDNYGNAYLGDFGVIKALAAEERSNLTQVGTVLGTLQYLAPEVLLSQRLDGRADQYGLAVTVYEVLTGRYPFPGDTTTDLLGQQMGAPPKAPHLLVAGVPEALSRAVLRALAREPAGRYSDCASFAREALAAAGSPVAVARPLPGPGLEAPPAAAAPLPTEQLPCPLCQEMLALTTAHRGQRIQCPFCAANLAVSGDLRRVTVASRAHPAVSVSPAPVAEETAPGPSGPRSPTAEVVGPMTFSVPIDLPPQDAFRPAELAGEVPPPGPAPGKVIRASAPVFLPDLPAPRRSRALKVVLLACLGAALMGGLAFGTFMALRYFRGNGGKIEADVVVDPSGAGQYKTLQEALAAAPAGAVIAVRPGVYRESLVLDRPVQLVGDGPLDEIVIEAQGGPCLRIQADEVVLRGLTLRGRAGLKEYAVIIPRGQPVLEGCAVVSGGLGGVAIAGAAARPVLRKCRVHDCQGAGVLIHTEARPVLEDCQAYANEGAGVEVREGAAPELRDCVLRDGKDVGLLVHMSGKGKAEGCTIRGNALAGVAIRDQGDPVLVGCKVVDGNQEGVLVDGSGAGRLEDCTVAGNARAGVEVRTGGTTLLHKCTVRDGHATGVLLRQNCSARLEECLIHGNHLAGVEIREGANPLLQGCKIYDGKSWGVSVEAQGKGRLEDCDIHDNAGSGVAVGAGGVPQLNKCRIHANKEAGLFVRDGGKGIVSFCTISGNAFAGVSIRDGGDPALQDCKIHGGKKMGVAVFREGKGTLERCEIWGNAREEVYISEGGNPVLNRCKLKDGRGGGLLVCESGKGTLEDCEISGCAQSGAEIRENSTPVLRRCQINRNKGYGVWAHHQATGTVESCDLTGNVQGARNVAADSRVTGEGNRE
jgi:hypothetical protein